MKNTLCSWLNILIGCIIVAAGFVFFINPYNIVPGGAYGASIVLHNLFPSIQVGTFGYMFDIPLLVLSVVLLGTKLGARTIAAALTTPLLMNMMSKMAYPTEEALHALDPSQLIGGTMNLSDHLMLACVMGATLIGIGTGIVVRNQATTGGSDIVGMLLQKYCHIRFSKAILLVDGAVVCFGLLVIGFGIGSAEDSTQPSWHLPSGHRTYSSSSLESSSLLKVAPTADSAAGVGVEVADWRSRAASCSGVTLAVRTISLTSAASAS